MKIGFIGTGHMAGSIIKALAKNEENIFYINDIDLNKAKSLKEEFSNNIIISNIKQIFNESSFIFLGVKPSDLGSLLEECKDYINDKHVIVSMVSGYELRKIINIIGDKQIIRIMPNTPVIVSKGVTFMAYNNISDEIKVKFKDIMSLTGTLYEVDESKIDVVSVLTGSSPAYLDYFIDALAKFGIKMGFSEEEANELVLKMCEGTIALNFNSNKSPIELGNEVCSPGGSTIEGVKSLLANDFYKIILDAAMASYNKVLEINKK